MGKLKDLLIEIDQIIEEETQEGWDEAVLSVYDAKDATEERIIVNLEKLAKKYDLEFEDLEELFQSETLRDKIMESIEYVWDI